MRIFLIWPKPPASRGNRSWCRRDCRRIARAARRNRTPHSPPKQPSHSLDPSRAGTDPLSGKLLLAVSASSIYSVRGKSGFELRLLNFLIDQVSGHFHCEGQKAVEVADQHATRYKEALDCIAVMAKGERTTMAIFKCYIVVRCAHFTRSIVTEYACHN